MRGVIELKRGFKMAVIFTWVGMDSKVTLYLYKKRECRICNNNNNRGIALLCTTSKTYEAILESKLR